MKLRTDGGAFKNHKHTRGAKREIGANVKEQWSKNGVRRFLLARKKKAGGQKWVKPVV